MWCVRAHVCVFLRGCNHACGLLVLVVLVRWWCDAGCVAPLWFGGVGCCPLLVIINHNYSKMFEPARNAHNVWTPIGMLTTKSKHTGVLPGGLGPLVVWRVGVLVVCFLRAPPINGLMVLVSWCVGVHVCVFLMGGCCPLWFGGVVCVLVVCCLGVLPIVGWRFEVLVWWYACVRVAW